MRIPVGVATKLTKIDTTAAVSNRIRLLKVGVWPGKW